MAAPHRERRRQMLWGYLLIAPNLAGLTLFYLWPVLQNLYFSLTEWLGFGRHVFAGLVNYLRLVNDELVLRSFLNTGLYALLTAPATIVISIVLAVLVSRKTKINAVYRVILLLPAVTMPVAVGMVWRWLFNGDYGLINQALAGVGLSKINWMSGSTALVSVAIVGVWSGVGYSIIVLLGGLQNIDRACYEAAALDGAGPVRTFVSITLPLLTPSIFFLTVTSVISSFQVFDLVFLMIDPGSSAIDETRTAVYSVYEQSFVMGDKGYGAAIAVVLFLAILIITIVQMRLQKRWVFYA
ncbi:carbohydrate ABC transporter permease [Microlunatus parietis]|uniref:Multiple sugar transport system permease protein n=1 Tax=Microlunatus parietis TaxID=682979 RepID=A0A7Y9I7A9_9ACTN|nr:sugar ABC transporter permease [Microlunatus parietis]NYE71613.1 multiple sugar transport system permease protein [Microlunatus parietis]